MSISFQHSLITSCSNYVLIRSFFLMYLGVIRLLISVVDRISVKLLIILVLFLLLTTLPEIVVTLKMVAEHLATLSVPAFYFSRAFAKVYAYISISMYKSLIIFLCNPWILPIYSIMTSSLLLDFYFSRIHLLKLSIM